MQGTFGSRESPYLYAEEYVTSGKISRFDYTDGKENVGNCIYVNRRNE